MSDQEPDPGVPLSPPGPESEPGAANTEVFASAEFATGPSDGADEGGRKVDQKQGPVTGGPGVAAAGGQGEEYREEHGDEDRGEYGDGYGDGEEGESPRAVTGSEVEAGLESGAESEPGAESVTQEASQEASTPAPQEASTPAPESVLESGSESVPQQGLPPAAESVPVTEPVPQQVSPAAAPGWISGGGDASGAIPGAGAGAYAAYGAPGGPAAPDASPTPAPASGGKRHRTGWILGLGLGYAILAGGTAFGVIVGTSPASVDVTAVNASAYAAPLGAAATGAATGAPVTSSSAKAKSSASPTAAPTTAAPTTAAPTTASPTSTVTGSVSDGTHSGDLRYFLLPPPDGPSSVQGDPDGTTQSLNDVLASYNDPTTARDSLNQLGFKTACQRTYQDSSIGANVTIQLMQFGSSSASSDWLSTFSYSGNGYQSISVPGESGAQGWSFAKNDNYELVGVYREGDTFYQVLIYGTQLIPAQDLGQVISAEHARLANG